MPKDLIYTLERARLYIFCQWNRCRFSENKIEINFEIIVTFRLACFASLQIQVIFSFSSEIVSKYNSLIVCWLIIITFHMYLEISVSQCQQFHCTRQNILPIESVVPYVDSITYLTRGSCNKNMLFIQSFHLIYTTTFVTVRELVKIYSTITV